MVTPFRADGTIDEKALRQETAYLIDTAGVHGLAVCGSTGEGHTLSTGETRSITEMVVAEAAGRVPVITGIITNSTAAVIERGKAVKDLGVTALQVTPPHYLFRPDDDSLERHFAEVADATELPVMIYNVVPWSYLSPHLLVRILNRVEGVIGVKQSAGDLKLLADLLVTANPGARIMTAVDALLFPSFALGAAGAIAAILTAAPQMCVALWNAVQAGDHARARVQLGSTLVQRRSLTMPPASMRPRPRATTEVGTKRRSRSSLESPLAELQPAEPPLSIL